MQCNYGVAYICKEAETGRAVPGLSYHRQMVEAMYFQYFDQAVSHLIFMKKTQPDREYEFFIRKDPEK